MKFFKNFSAFIILVLCFTSCSKKHNSTAVNVDNNTIINYNDYDIELNDKIDIEDYDIILLSNLNEDCLFTNIAKTIIKDDKIYILSGIKHKKLVVYNTNGDALYRIGNLGNGPEEYIAITDFTVDDDENVFIVDGISRKIIQFDKNNKFMSKKDAGHEIWAITHLPNNEFLLGICGWDKSSAADFSLVRTDDSFKLLEGLMPKNETMDINFLFLSPQIVANDKNEYTFNLEINNNIILCDSLGQAKRIITLDFGKYNMPDEAKVSLDENSNFSDYRFIIGGVYYANDKLWLHVMDRGELKWVMLDTATQTGQATKVKGIYTAIPGFYNGYPILSTRDYEDGIIELNDSLQHKVDVQEYQFVAIHK